jgi:nucleoid-associated protein YgaU
MTEERTEVFGAYEGDAGYDEPYDEPPRPRVLWGRVAALFAFMLVAFLLGRITAPSGGVPQARLDEALEQRDAARAEAERLQAQLEAQQQEPAALPTPEPTRQPEPEIRTYTVQSGDTLSKIAERFYGDPSLDDFLAEYNGIDDPTALHVGQEIKIPPPPEG